MLGTITGPIIRLGTVDSTVNVRPNIPDLIIPVVVLAVAVRRALTVGKLPIVLIVAVGVGVPLRIVGGLLLAELTEVASPALPGVGALVVGIITVIGARQGVGYHRL